MELRLVENLDGTKQKWIDPRPSLINLFNAMYLEVTGGRNPFPYGACMKAMLHFETTDTKTGELFIEYPEVDIWNEQLAGFFKDEFARTNRSYHFTYLLKQFGSFHKPTIKQKAITSQLRMVICDNCGKLRPPLGGCKHCGS